MSTRASNKSISGEERPTKEPSECTGPGCDSPGQVHADKRWPGSNDCTKKYGFLSASVGIENTRNLSSQVYYRGRGHRAPRPQGGFEFQERSGPEEYQHHRNHSCRATETGSEKRETNKRRHHHQAIETSTVPGTAFCFRIINIRDNATNGHLHT